MGASGDVDFRRGPLIIILGFRRLPRLKPSFRPLIALTMRRLIIYRFLLMPEIRFIARDYIRAYRHGRATAVHASSKAPTHIMFHIVGYSFSQKVFALQHLVRPPR